MLRKILAIVCCIFGLSLVVSLVSWVIGVENGSPSTDTLSISGYFFLAFVTAIAFATLLWRSRSEMAVWGVALLASPCMAFCIIIFYHFGHYWYYLFLYPENLANEGIYLVQTLSYPDSLHGHPTPQTAYYGWTLTIEGNKPENLFWYQTYDTCWLLALLLVPVASVLSWAETLRLFLARRARNREQTTSSLT
ncbi:MAG: hypothetical protein AAGK14_06045 [Verrucomicrobiota bacterium]